MVTYTGFIIIYTEAFKWAFIAKQINEILNLNNWVTNYEVPSQAD